MIDVHAGDSVLNPILKRLDGLYSGASDVAEKQIKTFLNTRKRLLQPKKNESITAYRRRLQTAFTGPKWALARHRIAVAFTEANEDVTGLVNDGLVEAFAVGMSESAYMLSKSGVDALPITAAIVAKLMAAGVIKLNERKLKRRKDIAYTEQRIQSSIIAAIYQDVTVDDMPGDVSRRVTNSRKNDMTAFARAAIYGASDTGAYYAGLEAEKSGLELEKTWLGIMDALIRPSHKHLHGTTIPMHEVFHGYHGTLRYPHDPSAPPQETYRCRCRMVVHLKGHAPAISRRMLLPTQTSDYRKWRDKQIRRAGGEVELAKLHRQLMG